MLTLLSAFVLGRVVGPALDALLGYFALAVSYLQFVQGASSGLVFMALFGVILFLVLNLATLILSMSFFLGKTQKIFQQRFNDGTPIETHKRSSSGACRRCCSCRSSRSCSSSSPTSSCTKINGSLSRA